MKRMLVTTASVLAAAAFAAPASASDANAIADPQVAPPCYYGETYSECAFRLARDADDIAIDTAQFYVNYAGYLAGWGLTTAKGVCGQVIRSCGTLL